MIRLTITVEDIATVIQVYDRIRYQRATSETGTYTTVSGLGPTTLLAGVSTYTETDLTGESTHWYRSQYYSTTTSYESSWSDPILGETGDIFYNPLYPAELTLGTAQQLVLDRVRVLIGDPVGLLRDSGEGAAAQIHFDNKTYELENKGWPASIHMGGTAYNTSTNPTVNGYRYLIFNEDISGATISGSVEYGVDIWYYNFRWSDKEIMDTYDNTPPPTPLTTTNCTAEIYMLTCAYDLLSSETWQDLNEDGASIRDEGSHYNPEPGLAGREAMLKRLRKRLDDAIKSVQLLGITGVLID